MSVNQIRIGIETQLKFQGQYIKSRCIVLCQDALHLKKLKSSQREKIEALMSTVELLPDPYGWSRNPNISDLNEIVGCLNVLDYLLDSSPGRKA